MKKGGLVYSLVLVALVAVMIYVLVNKYNEIGNMKAMGKVVLYPIDFKEETQTRQEDGVTYVTGHIYYIKYCYQFDGSEQELYLKTKDVYDVNDFNIAKRAVKNEEIIERFLFEDKEKGIVVSEKSATIGEYQRERISGLLTIFLAIIAIVAFPGIFMCIVWGLKKGEIEKIKKEMPSAVVCLAISITFVIVVEIGILMIIMGRCIEAANSQNEAANIVGNIIIIEGIVLVVVFVLLIWNKMVIFDKDRIIEKTLWGKEKIHYKNEVLDYGTLNYSVYNSASSSFTRRRNFWIKTQSGKISINDCMTNYYEAIEFVSKYYKINTV